METDKTGVHLSHCYQGEEWGWCKYGDEDCPAKAVAKEQAFTVTVQDEADDIVSQSRISVQTLITDPDLLAEIVLNHAWHEKEQR